MVYRFYHQFKYLHLLINGLQIKLNQQKQKNNFEGIQSNRKL
uniref:Uncharacterized protein n=1 Tax=Nelumbo nucifera TaxID=4432 RepID=A0A822ZHB1_NELNU|nr:TPA_asm: hypothetical protein HUJ06_002120 [Nelumbo nucifera]